MARDRLVDEVVRKEKAPASSLVGNRETRAPSRSMFAICSKARYGFADRQTSARVYRQTFKGGLPDVRFAPESGLDALARPFLQADFR